MFGQSNIPKSTYIFSEWYIRFLQVLLKKKGNESMFFPKKINNKKNCIATCVSLYWLLFVLVNHDQGYLQMTALAHGFRE